MASVGYRRAVEAGGGHPDRCGDALLEGLLEAGPADDFDDPPRHREAGVAVREARAGQERGPSADRVGALLEAGALVPDTVVRGDARGVGEQLSNRRCAGDPGEVGEKGPHRVVERESTVVDECEDGGDGEPLAGRGDGYHRGRVVGAVALPAQHAPVSDHEEGGAR